MELFQTLRDSSTVYRLGWALLHTIWIGAALAAILAHELAHVRRYDYLVNLLQSLAEALLFYHPAVWFISRRIRLERENCCDDLALAACCAGDGESAALRDSPTIAGASSVAERALYAQSLLTLAERAADGRLRRSVAAAMGATGRPSQLRLRIARLLGRPAEDARHHLVRTWPLTAFFLMATLLAVGLWASCSGQAANVGAAGKALRSPAEQGSPTQRSEGEGSADGNVATSEPRRGKGAGDLVPVKGPAETMTAKDILAGVEAARSRIKDFEVKFYFNAPNSPQNMVGIQEITAMLKGEKRYVQNSYGFGSNGTQRFVRQLSFDGQRTTVYSPGPSETATVVSGIETGLQLDRYGFFQIMWWNPPTEQPGNEQKDLVAFLKAGATVRPETEILDGRTCHVVELHHFWQTSTIAIWLDTERGYLPLRTVFSDGSQTNMEFRIEQAVELEKGLWFATRATKHVGPPSGRQDPATSLPSGGLTWVMGVEGHAAGRPAVRVDSGIPDAAFDLTTSLPFGTRIWDKQSGVTSFAGLRAGDEPARESSAASRPQDPSPEGLGNPASQPSGWPGLQTLHESAATQPAAEAGYGAAAASSTAAAVDVPALVREVRESQQWIHSVKTFYLRMETEWTVLPEYLAARKAALARAYPDRTIDKQNFPELEPGFTRTCLWAFDATRITFRYDTQSGDRYRSYRAWNGSLFTAFESDRDTGEQLHYFIGDKLGNQFNFILPHLSWLRASWNAFWWTPPELKGIQVDASPEEFVLLGQETFRGQPCYVLKSPFQELDPKWYVAVKDHRLLGMESYGLREDSGPQLLEIEKSIAKQLGKDVSTAEEYTDWLRSLPPEKYQQAHRMYLLGIQDILRRRVTFWLDDYQEVAPGKWMPMKQGNATFEELSEGKVRQEARYEVKVSEVRIDQELDPKLFEILPHAGDTVTDLRETPPLTYTLNKDRTAEEWEKPVGSAGSSP